LRRNTNQDIKDHQKNILPFAPLDLFLH